MSQFMVAFFVVVLLVESSCQQAHQIVRRMCVPHRYGPLNYNLEAFEGGNAPQGFPGWPF